MVQQTVSSAQYLEKLRQRRVSRRATNVQPQMNAPHQQQYTQAPNQSPPTAMNTQAQPAYEPTPPANQSIANPAQPQNEQPAPDMAGSMLPEDYGLQESQIIPGMAKPLPEEEILTWAAPSRPFKKHNRKFFSTVAIIALLVALIFFFAGQGLLPVAVAGSVTFLIYVLFTIPPQQVTNKITTYGIRIEKVLYYWEELGRFWFDEKYGKKILYIETSRFPGRITLLLGSQEQEMITDILAEVLLNQQPEPTFFEKAGNWLSQKLPLDFD